MKSFNFENCSDHEWEDRGELIWNEFDWLNYLKENNEFVEQFIELYKKHISHPNRLDAVATALDWNPVEWVWKNNKNEEFLDLVEQFLSNHTDTLEDEDIKSFKEVYTIHDHPVFIATVGLCRYLSQSIEAALTTLTAPAAKSIWQLGSSLHTVEMNMILSVQALDMGDYALTISYNKLALHNFNQLFGYLRMLIGNGADTTKDIYNTVFDIREIILRLMEDCRTQIHNGPSSAFDGIE
jgi:hypothetical protein